MQETDTVLTVTNDWLDSDVAADYPLVSGYTGGYVPSVSNNVQYYYQWVPSTTWYTTPYKIRLKLSEIEKLRAAAKKDKALKAVLQKFTHAIEIQVDFE